MQANQTHAIHTQALLVIKFGGTSLGDLRAMVQSARVTLKRGARVVVVSAMAGVTNKLIEMMELARAGDEAGIQLELQKLRRQHLDITANLGLSREQTAPIEALQSELHALLQGIRLLGECTPRATDAVLSMGERLSSHVFMRVLEAEIAERKNTDLKVIWFDVREVMATDERFGHAIPDVERIAARTAERLLPILENASSPPATKTVVVTQGFVGRSPGGATTTLGRGGSDYSAALLAEALHSPAVEIWTDVRGIATTDPRIVDTAQIIPEISFNEAAEAATFGAKVLHPATVLPAIRQNIPVFVASTFQPDQDGTWVRATVGSRPLVRAIALKRKQVLLTLTTPEMLYAYGFLARVFQIFAEYQVSIDNVTTSQVSIAVTLDDATLLNSKLMTSLAAVAQVTREDGLALVSVIGNQINHTPGLSARIFDSLRETNVRMIGLGASEHQFCIMVSESEAEDVVRRLHATLISP